MMKIVHMAHMNVNVIYFFSAKVDSVLMPWIGNRRAWNPSICKYKNFENDGSLNGNPWYHEFENRDVWKSMSGVKFSGESYRKYYYYFWFSANFVLTRHIVQIWLWKRIFLCGYSGGDNRIITSLWKVNLNALELMNKKRTFSWNHEYENLEF